jgi:hypothetical protein
VVTLGIDRVGLNFGALVVAIDLADAQDPQLHVASELAALSNQKLLVMTVARDGRGDHEVAQDLRTRARPRAGISTRRHRAARRGGAGDCACAVAEGAGLVIMGVRKGGRRSSGNIALEVLQTRRAHVLVVPSD